MGMYEGAESSRCQIGTLKRGQNIKYLPYAFTEQGVAMLSSVLRSPQAVQVNSVWDGMNTNSPGGV